MFNTYHTTRTSVKVDVHVPESEADKQARDLVNKERRIRDLEDQLARREHHVLNLIAKMVEDSWYDNRMNGWCLYIGHSALLVAESPEIQSFLRTIRAKQILR
jgi:hypothetical protein